MTKTCKLLIVLLFAARLTAARAPVSDALATRPDHGWSYTELSRMSAPEAKQGVAADDDYFYVITNFALGKYRRNTHERVGGWACKEDKPLTHINAAILYQGVLYGSHSNYPGVPMASSVEMWDPKTMKHIDSHSFGVTNGSLTWLDRYEGGWIACFVHYGNRGGEPGRGPEWSRLVKYDNDWCEEGGWIFPADLMARLGKRGYSVSGGAIGPEGNLYVSGHDDAALYVLKFPEAGPTLEWVATIPISTQGQAFDWDDHDSRLLYTINKRTREVVVGRVQRTQP